MKNKVIAVTGAGSGVGRAAAFRLAQKGARLALADVDVAQLDAVAARLPTRSEKFEVDISDANAVRTFVDTTVATLGTLDGFVCCAGTTTTVPALELSLDEWNRILKINLTGTFLCVQAAAQAMAKSSVSGSIVAVSSGLAVMGQRGGAHYSASKAGVLGMIKSFALELGSAGIRLNSIAPGVVETPLLRRVATEDFVDEMARRSPLGRIGQPDDIAEIIIFLLSDSSRWLTGQTFFANGGTLMP